MGRLTNSNLLESQIVMDRTAGEEVVRAAGSLVLNLHQSSICDSGRVSSFQLWPCHLLRFHRPPINLPLSKSLAHNSVTQLRIINEFGNMNSLSSILLSTDDW